MSKFIPAFKPQDCDLLLVKAIEEGDIDTLIELYEPGAAFFLFTTGELTYSPEAIRAEFEGLISMKPKMVIEEIVTTIHQDGNLATTNLKGYMDSFAPDGQAIHSPFHSLEVLRKQIDGTWRFAIDDLQGSAKQ